VHPAVSIPPKYAVSNFMGYLKGKLATGTPLQYVKWQEQREKQQEAIQHKLFD
jgi:REP element-mobilizing transposase RayT